MPYKLKDNRGVISDPFSFRDASNLTAEFVAESMKEKALEAGVPMDVSIDSVKEGGLFGSSYPCVVIKHPNPPQQYFTDVYVINGNTVNFLFFGYSEANYKTNKANARKNSLTGMILNSISGSQEMAYQQEMLWHKQVYDVFESLVH